MVAWFIIAIATLGVFAFIAVSGVQNVATTSDAVGRVETVRRLDSVANALLARAAPAISGDNTIYLPVGANNPAGQGYGLPTDLAVQGQTPFGQRFVYCPFGATGGTGAALTITSADSSSYTVATAAYLGKNYVVGGRPAYPQLAANPNILGWVLAPRTKISAIPSCDQVIFNPSTGKFEAPDAIVRSITRDAGVDEARTVSSRKITYFVSPSGAGSGASSNDPASLETALAFYRSRLPAKMEIVVAPGYYTITGSSLNIVSEATQTELTIRGTGSVDFDMDVTGYITIPGTLTLENINVDSTTTVTVTAGRKFRLVNSSLGRIANWGGKVELRGTNTLNFSVNDYPYVSAGEASLDVSDGNVTILSSAGLGFALYGGNASFTNSTVVYAGSGSNYVMGIYIDTPAEVRIRGGSQQFNKPIDSHGVFVFGRLQVVGVTFQLNGSTNSNGYLIGIYKGGQATLHGSVVGAGTAKAQWTIVDHGSVSIGGEGTNVYKGWSGGCWWGNMFAESDNVSSQVLPDAPIPVVNDPPTAAEVRAYAVAVGIQSRRALKRAVNGSSWACQP